MNDEQHLCAIGELDDPICRQLTPLKNLQAILQWIPSVGLSLSQFDSVQQDEYNYDVFFPWHDHRWIAFGVS